ncbi:hypothetical protein Caci_2791 [Catenulispora acidiphila DSM 44928]|uniref:Uncharacterized protein n=1 Tax=Catenulispora acidiphila (strain DSM 44928 / JCM 14897 / NBRC 102108 / NRRL B-24433 / ID139908) TaxID=479433 RepID=C7Q129_CATAD|nr:hypothetical protein Caci_2791 [Catenulispora acidiphila DSM 44928]
MLLLDDRGFDTDDFLAKIPVSAGSDSPTPPAGARSADLGFEAGTVLTPAESSSPSASPGIRTSRCVPPSGSGYSFHAGP